MAQNSLDQGMLKDCDTSARRPFGLQSHVEYVCEVHRGSARALPDLLAATKAIRHD
jgi:hypothetical protein